MNRSKTVLVLILVKFDFYRMLKLKDESKLSSEKLTEKLKIRMHPGLAPEVRSKTIISEIILPNLTYHICNQEKIFFSWCNMTYRSASLASIDYSEERFTF